MRKNLLVWRLRHRAKLLFRTGGNAVVDTLIEVKAEAVMSTFPHVQAKIVTNTLIRY